MILILIGMQELSAYIMFLYEARMIRTPMPRSKLIFFGFGGMELTVNTGQGSKLNDCTELDFWMPKRKMLLDLSVQRMSYARYISFQPFRWEQQMCF